MLQRRTPPVVVVDGWLIYDNHNSVHAMMCNIRYMLTCYNVMIFTLCMLYHATVYAMICDIPYMMT